MDNEAFRALINKQRQSSSSAAGGGPKSTKEIAREAVENEFQKKRSRRGGGGKGRAGYNDGYGSDSGGSSDEDYGSRRKREAVAKEQDEDDNEPEWKRRRREKRLQDGGEYRDRARERREGKNADYAALSGLASSASAQLGEEDRKRQAELSKYLGGDEEHTHLVKGLDKALAEKVRREEMGIQGDGLKDTGDLDQLLEESYVQKQKQQLSPKRGEDDWMSSKPKTELGKSVLSYLLQKQKTSSTSSNATTSYSAATAQHIKTNPTIQKSIQHSILTFSLNSDVRRKKEAWEVPRISVKAFGTKDNSDTMKRRMTPLNQHMIATISKKLDGSAGVKGKEKDWRRYGAHDDDEKKESNGTKCDKLPRKEEGKRKEENKAKAESHGKTSKYESDSDDDIFADAGNYVPQALTHKPTPTEAAEGDKEEVGNAKNGEKEKEETTKDTKQAKQSIFDNLVTEDVAPKPVIKPQQQHLPKQNIPSDKDVINRDIFGGEESQQLPYQKRRGPQSAAIEGVSMTTYQGGYGEEMDVDFGGDDDWRKKKKGDDENEGGEEDGDQDLADED